MACRAAAASPLPRPPSLCVPTCPGCRAHSEACQGRSRPSSRTGERLVFHGSGRRVRAAPRCGVSLQNGEEAPQQGAARRAWGRALRGTEAQAAGGSVSSSTGASSVKSASPHKSSSVVEGLSRLSKGSGSSPISISTIAALLAALALGLPGAAMAAGEPRPVIRSHVSLIPASDGAHSAWLQTRNSPLLLAAASPGAPAPEGPLLQATPPPDAAQGSPGSRRSLPEGFVKSASDVERALRASLAVAPAEEGFRAKAESAKEAIRSFIVNWRGKASVSAEESYASVERVLRELSRFYSSNGPQATIPPNVRAQLLAELDRLSGAL